MRLLAGGRFVLRLAEGPREEDWAAAEIAGPDAGCVVSFRGTVRARSRGRAVRFLEYQAYEWMVAEELERIASEVLRRHSALRCAVEHALGRVPVAACSVVLAVAAAHRPAAFAAAAEFMDELKQRAPIWKREVYADGSAWIGQGS